MKAVWSAAQITRCNAQVFKPGRQLLAGLGQRQSKIYARSPCTCGLKAAAISSTRQAHKRDLVDAKIDGWLDGLLEKICRR
jgi:hypothetical protein